VASFLAPAVLKASANLGLEVPPGPPDWNAYVTHIDNLAEQFPELVEQVFQHNDSQNIGGVDAEYH
jgi:hypothetical protein